MLEETENLPRQLQLFIKKYNAKLFKIFFEEI
jgi:hypothetical protein